MKVDEFMDALSGVDPQYIEEAALELKEDTVAQIIEYRRKKAVRRRRIYGTCISAAACLALVFMTVKLNFFRPIEKGSENATYNEYMQTESSGSKNMSDSSSSSEDIMESSLGEAVEEVMEAPSSNMFEAEEEGGKLEGVLQENMDSELNMESAGQPNSDSYGEKISVVWEEADFVGQYVPYSSKEKIVKLKGNIYHRYTLAVSEHSCDVDEYEASIIDGKEIIFAYNSDTDDRYAYYAKENLYYLISAHSMNEDAFVSGAVIIIEE